jgi:photosystem II stability/assembly factor-like uncharacterized protein
LFLTESLGFVVGNAGYIGRTIDGGETWTQCTSPPGIYEEIQFVNPRIGYCMSLGGTVVKTLDSGSTWTTVLQVLVQFNAMYFADELRGVVSASTRPYVFQTVDGGATWDTVPSEMHKMHGEIRDWAFPSPGKGVAVSWNGAVYRVAGLIDSAVEVTRATGPAFGNVDFGDSLFGCAIDGAVHTTRDGGQTWRTDTLPFAPVGTAVFPNGSIMLIGGDSSAHSDDYGHTWRYQSLPFRPTHFTRVPTTERVYIVGENTLLASDDAGRTIHTVGTALLDVFGPSPRGHAPRPGTPP